jgi:hypothetical protein
MLRRGAWHVARILSGADPAEAPVFDAAGSVGDWTIERVVAYYDGGSYGVLGTHVGNIKVAGPESVDIASNSDQWIYSRKLYAVSGDVVGRFFTQTNGTPPPYSPDKGFAVTGPFWDSWRTESEKLGYPISRAFKSNGLDTQVFQRNALQVGPSGIVAVISAQGLQVGAKAKESEPPPDTPYEVATGSDPGTRPSHSEGVLGGS